MDKFLQQLKVSSLVIVQTPQCSVGIHSPDLQFGHFVFGAVPAVRGISLCVQWAITLNSNLGSIGFVM